MNKLVWLGLASMVVLAFPEGAFAQPSRQLPGTRPYLPGSPPINQTPLNPRTRAAASAVGVESTDFYGKKGYPKVLGDAIESQTTGGAAGGVSASGGSISGGSISGGSISGSISGGLSGGAGGAGGGLSGGGLVGGFGIGNANGNGNALGQANTGITGGGFSGMGPKGFGFGGTPALEDSSLRWNRK
ncbi:MAG: hypothetical protein QM703_10520 [Gemmatales bacterium]